MSSLSRGGPRAILRRMALQRGRRTAASLGLALVVIAATAAARPSVLDGMQGAGGVSHCVGDCDVGGVVTVDELVKGVNILLRTGSLDQCPRFDCDSNGQVTVY